MNTTRCLRVLACATLALFAALPLGGAGEAQAQFNGAAQVIDPPPVGPPAISPLSPTAPPELVKPALPSELQTAESVFRKLDVARRGYVTQEDTKDLLGFDDAFRAVDTGGSGKLTPKQFKKAWSIYKHGKE